jgi:type I restriction enzyme S subunit
VILSESKVDEIVEVLSASKDGTDHLKSLIFNLATTGNLVPQIPDEKHAPEVIELVKGGEGLHETVPGWLNLKLSLCAEIYNGNSTNVAEKALMEKNQSGLEYIATKDVGYGFQSIDYDTGLRIGTEKNSFKIAPANSILMCLEGGSAGKKMGLLSKEVAFGNKLFAVVCKEWILPKFLLIYFLSSKFQNDFRQKMTGIIGGISKANFVNIQIPIPPLAEQNRIVKETERFVAICDALKRAQNDQHLLSGNFRDSSIDAISTAQSPQELQIAWERIQHNWEIIAGNTDAIDSVRTLILDLAVRGRLVSHDHSGLSAKELITESLRIASNKKVKHGRESQDAPFEIPEHWEWSTIQDLCETQTGITPKILNSDNSKDLVHYVTAADMVKLKAMNNRSVPSSAAKRGGRIAPKDSVLFVGIGATIGKCCLISSPATFNQQIHAATPRNINAQYLCLVLASGYFQKICIEKTNATAIPILNKSKWEEISVPVPPLNEQKKIAETVSELFKLCDELEGLFSIKSSLAEKLSRSIVSASA